MFDGKPYIYLDEIQNVDGWEKFARRLADSTGTTVSRNTLVDYLQLLNDAYLIFGVSNYSDKLSDKETYKERYFFDNGLLNNFLFDPETKLLENMVAVNLKQRYEDDFYFYNKNIEVVFTHHPLQKKNLIIVCQM